MSPPPPRRKPIAHKQMRPLHKARRVAGQGQRCLRHLHRCADAALGGGGGGVGNVDARGLQVGHLPQPVQGPVTRGQTALQRMPRSRSATAMARAKLWAASLVATCSLPSGGADHGRASRVGIAGPPPAAIKAGSAAPAIR